ncbi:MAG: hypothetical protein AAFR47_10745 [Pseudomonadota bacterium]
MSDQTDLSELNEPRFSEETIKCVCDSALTFALVAAIAVAALVIGPLFGLPAPTALCIGSALVIAIGVIALARPDMPEE